MISRFFIDRPIFAAVLSIVITLAGELILLDARANTCAIISRLRLFDEDVEIYSHPALVGTRLYARGGSSVVCVDLGTD